MTGMNRHTGRAITDERAHIRQSVTDILTTLVGTRVMRRDYGSVLPLLIDQPLNDATLLRAYSATVIALMRWEPRLQIQRITRAVDSSQPGRAILSVNAVMTEGQPLNFVVSLTDGAPVAPDYLEHIISGEYQMQRITEHDRVCALGGLHP